MRDGVDWTEKDVIRYDYQIMDDAYWLCEKAGYKIVIKSKSGEIEEDQEINK